jgi:polyhydroxyalkanoate synthase
MSSNTPAEQLDRQFLAGLGRMTSSVSVMSCWLGFFDWVGHLAVSPGKRLELLGLGIEEMVQLAGALPSMAGNGPECVTPWSSDRRFNDPAWHRWPFNYMQQSFLMTERWWKAATHGVFGVSPAHENGVAFAARQILDMFSPVNHLLTNPVVLQRTVAEGGLNLQRGFQYFVEDAQRLVRSQPPAGTEEFEVGRNLAVTPGKVVLRTRLMELIQYTPTTAKVHAEPVLIVPAWIMKYYILDLSPHNSLIKYLVDQGHTVFCISWLNPEAEDRDLGMDDYLQQGFFAALKTINSIVPGKKVHGTGYCLGGTLLSIAAAVMARDGDERLASVSLFAAQTDFTEPGELALFIDDSQISLLEAQMEEKGYLTAGQMAGAFQLLRSYDLLWSRLINEYMLGERSPMNDLMAWNADATRMPAKMHTQYLRRLFLHDDLSEGRYEVDGRPISLGDVRIPIFAVGTESDHVAPWRSVHKIHYLSPAEITFVLTSGGHNAGIVSEPGHPRRHYRIHTRLPGERYVAPAEWHQNTAVQDGSWWEEWHRWLAQRSSPPAQPPKTGSKEYPPLENAPGSYVLRK